MLRYANNRVMDLWIINENQNANGWKNVYARGSERWLALSLSQCIQACNNFNFDVLSLLKVLYFSVFFISFVHNTCTLKDLKLLSNLKCSQEKW